MSETSFLLISAGGGNSDILGAFERLAVEEPRRLIVMVGRRRSTLGIAARKYGYVDCVELDVPTGKDGFLATNSLLAFGVALSRAYLNAGGGDELPAKIETLLSARETMGQQVELLKRRCAPLWGREVLTVLHSEHLQAAAWDIESKFTEAAIGGVQVADFRQFAHGRHHWLAKKAAVSAVLALVGEKDGRLATRTLSLIPKDIPRVELLIKGDFFLSNLAALVLGVYVAGLAGEGRGIDPGRPGVPEFGRKIYQLRAIGGRGEGDTRTRGGSNPAVARKSGVRVTSCLPAGQAEYWEKAYSEFHERLSKARFYGAALDYDGTMCDEGNRFEGAEVCVISQIARLLKNGIPVGIATGRGKSVKDDLQRRLPERFWKRVVVGYYNGAEVGLLDDANLPQDGPPSDELAGLMREIESHGRIAAMATVEGRRDQIQVVPARGISVVELWQVVSEIVAEGEGGQFRVLRSGHAVDVLPRWVSKASVMGRLRALIGEGDSVPILCIGDCGDWPGNDYWLLSEGLSLSVDRVSGDPVTCWNLAPAGHRGSQALMDYLRCLRISKHTFRIAVDAIGASTR
jgi:hydroxymethylpyrimidine pyrophosphatase-like HAD family hydrolase